MKLLKHNLLIASLLAVSLLLAGCTGSKVEEFTASDLVILFESESYDLMMNQSLYIFENYTYVEDYASFSGIDKEIQYTLSRGITIGSSIEEFLDLYAEDESNIVWEVCYDDNSTEFFTYAGLYQDVPEDGVKWIDIGFYQVEDTWKALQGSEIAEIWFCNADVELYEEVILFSMYANADGIIEGMVINYFDYSQTFVNYQGWI